jgi:hypothetical protein
MTLYRRTEKEWTAVSICTHFQMGERRAFDEGEAVEELLDLMSTYGRPITMEALHKKLLDVIELFGTSEKYRQQWALHRDIILSLHYYLDLVVSSGHVTCS